MTDSRYMSDSQYKLLRAMNALAAAEQRTDKLMRKTYPIGTLVEIATYPTGPERKRLVIIGTVAYYCMPIIGGVVCQFTPEDLSKISSCWHLPRYKNCAEISWAMIIGPATEAMVSMK